MNIKRVFSFAEHTAEELDRKINTLLEKSESIDGTINATIGQTYRTYQSNMIQVGKKQTFKNTPYYTNGVTIEFNNNETANKFVQDMHELFDEQEASYEEEIDA